MVRKLPEWKKRQKSVHRELGWGSSKVGDDKKTRNKSWVEYKGRLICPKCGERRSTHVQESRPDFWYCDICKFEGDIDSWDVQTLTTKKAKKLG